MAKQFDNPALSVSGVTKRFGDTLALDNLTLEVGQGMIYGLLGPNGSGKTTLIRLSAGLLDPDAGSITVLGQDPSNRGAKSAIGYMTQLSALYLDLTVWENLDFFGRIYGLRRKARRDRIEELTALVDLEAKLSAPVRTLSGGMMQRVSLACALLHSPRIVFLDEPTVGVDPALRLSFWRYFRDLAAGGVTIIVSSHVMDEAGKCDRLGLLLDGRLLAEGDLPALLSQTGQSSLEDIFLFLSRGER